MHEYQTLAAYFFVGVGSVLLGSVGYWIVYRTRLSSDRALALCLGLKALRANQEFKQACSSPTQVSLGLGPVSLSITLVRLTWARLTDRVGVARTLPHLVWEVQLPVSAREGGIPWAVDLARSGFAEDFANMAGELTQYKVKSGPCSLLSSGSLSIMLYIELEG